MGSSVKHPFRRINTLYAGYAAAQARVAALRNAVESAQYQAAMDDEATARAALLGYTSRGHGGRHRTKNRCIGGQWSQDRSKYEPHQGKRECARRAERSL